jgi:SAM-dependent methyltransferase
MQQRIEQDGADGSGAYNFYVQRVAQEKVFLEYEIALAEKLLSCGLDIRHIHEVGCGFGQLVFLLGWNGFRAVGFEVDPARARTALRLQTILSRVDADLTRNVTILSEAFPSRRPRPPETEAMVLATNLVVSATATERRALVRAMRRYRFVVIDVQRFFDLRTEPGSDHETLALFAEAGFASPQLFLDLGQGGRYYLFEGPRSAPPKSGWLRSLWRRSRSVT